MVNSISTQFSMDACLRACGCVGRVVCVVCVLCGWVPWLEDVDVVQRLVHVLARAHRVEVHAEELAHLGEEVEHARLESRTHILQSQRHLRLRALRQRPSAPSASSAQLAAVAAGIP